MVNTLRRKKYAELLRHFFAGQITNHEYEYRADAIIFDLSHQDDPVLWAIWRNAWATYDGLFTHKMTGRHALTRENEAEVAKWITFLYTDQPYDWPSNTFSFGCLAVLNGRAQSQ
jgi:hypothetical protein